MLDISQHIVSLLHRFDCVVIPDMGGFVANYSAAILDRSKGVVYPPSKGIIFNKNLTKNDGLLVNEIAHNLTIDYNQAVQLLSQFVYTTKNTLQQGGRIELNGLGYLYLDHENNTQFLLHQTVNFLKESFGLNPVMAVPVTAKVVQQKTEVKLENKPKQDPAKQPEKEAKIVPIKEAVEKVKNNKRKYYWVAAALLPLLFYSYWIPFQTNAFVTGEFSLSDLNPFKKHHAPTYQLRTKQNNLVNDTTKLIVLEEKEIPLPETETVKETTLVPNPKVDFDMHFHVIAGCFINYENAINHINDLKASNVNAYLFGQVDGFYRVAMGSFANKNQAIQFLQQTRSAGQPNAWLLEE